MRDDDKPVPPPAMPTIPDDVGSDNAETVVHRDTSSTEAAARLALSAAARLSMGGATVPSFGGDTMPNFGGPTLPSVGTQPAPLAVLGPDGKPPTVPVDDLIADSLRSAVVLQRPPTISSLLGVPVQPIPQSERESLLPLSDQIPPSVRDGARAAATKPSSSRGALWLVIVLMLVAGGVAAAVFLR